jgi:transcriptional regulator with XRE-family HTH domain
MNDPEIRNITNPRTSNPNGFEGTSGMQTLGAILREAREAMGVSLVEVEETTRIRQKYLSALEADEWHLLPGEVVGRGFLRNYALFLGLDPEQLMERRRAMLDSSLLQALADTSAGAVLPAAREVDYRPKDVDLEETPFTAQLAEIAEASQSWIGPVLTIAAIVAVLFVGWWSFTQIGDELAGAVNSVQTRIARAAQANQSTPVAAAVSAETTPVTASENQPATANNGNDGTGSSTENGAGDGNTENPGDGSGNAGEQQPAVVDLATITPTLEPIPTNTPVPPPPTPTATNTPLPPTPTDTPVPPPTATPLVAVVVEPTATPLPAVVAPSCPDSRSVITAPGVNQVVAGAVAIEGRAVHEAFQYYKLEFAPGANAENGFVYFDGGQSPVESGRLGTFGSTGVPNGVYTIQLTVVDQTGNYPPQCRVTVTVQN